ncbi:uncharacterized protein LOC127915130 [Oncorhynchus keta]|uniref:uncharacterized protein LOC127915130 n=1 Tax=Oncorhynchus keta TaxID=8018 RepID=UPI00227C7057|nr:uncharacterized protein LOC127915130 [Oncorhynchus keta]
MYWRGHTGSVAKSGRRPEPTPRAYHGEWRTGQAPCYAVRCTVSPVRRHSPVHSIAAPRIGRARVGIEPGAMKPAQRIWSPVRLLRPGYMAPVLRMVSQVRQHSPVRSIPPRCTGLATGSIQPGAPSSPDLPESPSSPDLPESPSSPDLPESPSSPDLPESPSSPDLPDRSCQSLPSVLGFLCLVWFSVRGSCP